MLQGSSPANEVITPQRYVYTVWQKSVDGRLYPWSTWVDQEAALMIASNIDGIVTREELITDLSAGQEHPDQS